MSTILASTGTMWRRTSIYVSHWYHDLLKPERSLPLDNYSQTGE
jgi:hypothetical protein